jgi:hypothetical protein
MMTQSTLAVDGFDAHSKVTCKAAFLTRMDKLVPWTALEELIEPHYPKAGKGEPPRDLSTMLRMYCVVNCGSIWLMRLVKMPCTTLWLSRSFAALT